MINLVPETTRINNRYALRNTRLVRYTLVAIFTMASIMAITGIGILWMNKTENNLQKQASDDSAKLATYKSIQKQGQELSDQINTINTLLTRQVSFSTLLPEVAKIMPQGAVLKQLDFSTSDILPTAAKSSGSSSSSSSTQKPFVILAAVKDRNIAPVLLENIKSSKTLFTDADIVDVTHNTKDLNPDANALPSTTAKYPYQVTINAYLKKASTQTKVGGTK